MKKIEPKKGEIVIYKSPEGPKIEVKFERGNIWLTQDQIALLFGTKRPAITKHVNNIFKDGELKEKSVSSILEHTARDGKTYKTKFYALDTIISVGYRVNSKKATDFRVWATHKLKNFLIRGFAIDEKRLLETENKFKELQNAVDFLKQKSKHELLAGQEKEILGLLADYSKTLTLLEQYDKEEVNLHKEGKGKFILDHEIVKNVILEVKKELVNKKEASEFFGQENGEKLKGLMGAIYQTFEKKELYPSIEEKAAHLLYFIIKDQPFIDGNKRTASFLFVYFLDKNKYLYRETGEKKINDNALTALALLIAVSDPREKDKLIKIVTNLLK
ncbi:MAG: hypothetical protein A2599_02285 [Candidatus Staskawiczbacteria bacterium RIFOXYD1_FULL_39_28]|uniref:Fido domain-containing protein n=1 Tax=Candidatus Staskawiczbacteria bacterium RIFOXYC1_FULL_38_18 TaxID=1802229 RepID=A0A1G2JE78_9BACT|nr:MAG: hypothetical protein A2401_03300 [Candidatus Staskawiczbacteria bacterium RIFOXYC1_FULL_38_18]OGZ91896.1 MAG: hypothetical protein A2599_02285 [Candidatus Staskawiczbacteria bacterium RIFOXYD1_FULL_39_28]